MGQRAFELLDEIAYKLRDLVHRFAKLQQGVGAFLIDTLQPRADGIGGDQELSGCLLQGPAACGLHLEDGHSFGRPVVWSAMGREPGHAKLVDAEFLAQQSDLLVGSFQLCFQSDPGIPDC